MIITITNTKGGIGKTTCCINIGHGLVMNKKGDIDRRSGQPDIDFTCSWCEQGRTIHIICRYSDGELSD